MKEHMKKIPVYFALDDPDQLRLYQHVKSRKNHSGYIKRLIQRDMEGGSTPATPIIHEQPVVSRAKVGEMDFNAEGFI